MHRTATVNSHKSGRVEVVKTNSRWLKDMENMAERLWPCMNAHIHPHVDFILTQPPSVAEQDGPKQLLIYGNPSSSLPWLPSVSLHPLPITLSVALSLPPFCLSFSTHPSSQTRGGDAAYGISANTTLPTRQYHLTNPKPRRLSQQPGQISDIILIYGQWTSGGTLNLDLCCFF